jgi:hypothetical protein
VTNIDGTNPPRPSEGPLHPEVVDGAPERQGEGGDESNEQVTRPTKLIRIASMVRNMLEEVRRAPLDDAGRRMLREIHDRSLAELEGVLSPDLQAELKEVTFPFTAETPSESELRVAQAQLVGWLEGLFHGIQATLFTQQVAAQSQLDQMRQRQMLEAGGAGPGGPGRPPGPPGQYL